MGGACPPQLLFPTSLDNSSCAPLGTGLRGGFPKDHLILAVFCYVAGYPTSLYILFLICVVVCASIPAPGRGWWKDLEVEATRDYCIPPYHLLLSAKKIPSCPSSNRLILIICYGLALC